MYTGGGQYLRIVLGGKTDDPVSYTHLEKLRPYGQDSELLRQYAAVKRQKKEQLSSYLQKKEGVCISPDFMFDIQVKRLHEYKRQLMNALSILDLYFGVKDGRVQNFYPTAFLFGAKAAPGYVRACLLYTSRCV